METALVALKSSAVFAAISSPMTYKLTGKLGSAVGLELEDDGCPTTIGLITHAIVFTLVTKVLMMKSFSLQEFTSWGESWKLSLVAGVMFAAISHPKAYELTHSLLGKSISISRGDGCPTITGWVLHSAVYGLVVAALHYFGKW